VLCLLILVGWETRRQDESAETNSLMQEARELASLLQKISDKKQELCEELSTVQSLHQDEIGGLNRGKHRLENELIAANDRVSVHSSEIELRL